MSRMHLVKLVTNGNNLTDFSGTGSNSSAGNADVTKSGGHRESVVEERQRMAQENQRCEEREENLLLLEAARFSARRPEVWKYIEETLSQTSPQTPFTMTRVASAKYWGKVALTYFATSEDVEIQDKATLEQYPPSPFLSRLEDKRWMQLMQSQKISVSPTPSPSPPPSSSGTTATAPVLSLHGSLGKPVVQENLVRVFEDHRLFQLASGIFDGQATSGRDKHAKRVDESLVFSYDILQALIVDFGYLPLPEDDLDRRRHHVGGTRAQIGGGERFPDDEIYCSKAKHRHGSIWNFYNVQSVEVMTAYLIYKAPKVLDMLFDRGFTFVLQPGVQDTLKLPLNSDTATTTMTTNTTPATTTSVSPPKSRFSTLGISPSCLLQCCLPKCNSILRQIHYTQPKGQGLVTSAEVVSKIKIELLGLGSKPKRIEFTQQDFATVLRGLPCPTLEDYKGHVSILIDLGMEISAVQDRMTEVIQIPGGVTPCEVEPFILDGLLSALDVDWTVGRNYCSCGSKSSMIGSPVPGLAVASPHPLAYSESSSSSIHDAGHGPCLSCSGPFALSPTDLVNRTVQEHFEIDMDLSEAHSRPWRLMFEATLQNLRVQRWLIHPCVSDWILETFEPSQTAFRTSFDHAVLEALLGVLEWNRTQLLRLQAWAQRQENDTMGMNSKQSQLWENIKQDVVVRDGRGMMDGVSDGIRNGGWKGCQDRKNDEDGDESRDTVHNSRHHNMTSNDRDTLSSQEAVTMDLEWTTGDHVWQTTSTVVAGLPRGSDMVRLSGDGYLMLDNGCLEHSLLLCDIRSAKAEQQGSDAAFGDGHAGSLDSNARVSAYVEKGAEVQEKHLVWLALGLVTESFRGQVAGFRKRQVRVSMSSKGAVDDTSNDIGGVMPVKMACSPEAYQLVWILVTRYILQAMKDDEAATVAPVSFHPDHDSYYAEHARHPTKVSASASARTSPVPVPQVGCAARIQALKEMVRERVGPAASALFVDIVTEIEGDLEDQLAANQQ
ncbi:hypothetical protein BGZ94_006709 [Podila epigama]|nr:hypothetical protein BGZ94_006709 [Podila epigama]